MNYLTDIYDFTVLSLVFVIFSHVGLFMNDKNEMPFRQNSLKLEGISEDKGQVLGLVFCSYFSL